MTRLVPLAGVILALCLSGCAVGRTADGKVNFGPTLDDLPANAGEAVAKAATFLPEPWQSIAIGAGSLLLGTGGAAAAGKRAKSREDAAWDAAQRELFALLHPGPGAGAVRPEPAAADPRRDGDPAGPT